MTVPDLIALSPILTLGIFCIITMLAIAVRRNHTTIAILSGVFCFLTLATLPVAATVAPRPVTTLLIIDRYAMFYMGLLLAATGVVIGLSHGYLQLHFAAHEEVEEFYLLVLLATFGGLVMVAAAHLASFFLGLELIGVSLYGLIGYLRTRRGPLEAALKYLILSSTASAFLLLGMALMYFDMGTMEFGAMGTKIAADGQFPALWMAGFVFILIGVGFKLGLVPLHLWIPDVYQGAPAPVTAYVATVSKGAVFALLLRFIGEVHALQSAKIILALGLIAAACMFTGNFLALLQDNVKRLLAYSSIAHFGYLLVALLAGGSLAAEAVTFYLVAYFATTLGAFGVVTALSTQDRDADSIEDYRGLLWSHPWLAATFMLMLLSLVGIPVTAGFVGKFYAITAGMNAGLLWLVALLVLNSAIGAYYYLRLLIACFDSTLRKVSVPARQSQTASGWSAILSLGLTASLVLWLGLYPQPMIAIVKNVVGPLVPTFVGLSF
jgi:NADH-quinone oxidoreductase subunit N